MKSKPFSEYILLIASSRFGRLFFCTRKIHSQIWACTGRTTIFETDDFVLFQADIPHETDIPIESACKTQFCHSCKGYGLVGPTQVYNHIQSLGLQPLRKLDSIDWYTLTRNKQLFNQLCEICKQKAFVDCESCLFSTECSYKLTRRFCIPIKSTVDQKRNPYFHIDINKIRAGIFPFLLLNPDLLLCNNTTIRSQALGIFQQGMRNRPRFYVAPFKSSMSIIKINHNVWDLCYQYAVARFYKMSIKVRPFIATDDLHKQITFGTGFAKVEDYSSFLWRYRPLVTLPLLGQSVYKGFKPESEAEVFNLDYTALVPRNEAILRVQIGLHRVFGLSSIEYNGSGVIYDPKKI